MKEKYMRFDGMSPSTSASHLLKRMQFERSNSSSIASSPKNRTKEEFANSPVNTEPRRFSKIKLHTNFLADLKQQSKPTKIYKF